MNQEYGSSASEEFRLCLWRKKGAFDARHGKLVAVCVSTFSFMLFILSPCSCIKKSPDCQFLSGACTPMAAALDFTRETNSNISPLSRHRMSAKISYL